jgi:hypothetical protein
MNTLIKSVAILLVLFGLNSCQNQNPNINKTGKDELVSLELDHKIDKDQIEFEDMFYVPIYSDIYVSEQNQKSLLAATLSIRNTSYSDSLFVSKIDYFNTEGKLVRSYLDNPISLPPMATVNYVIEKEDASGGSGANFIVALSAMNKNIRPIIQAIMIGENGNNQGFAFSTDGYSIK